MREGALASAWMSLAGVNLALLATRAPLPPGRPLLLAALAAAFNAATLLATGAWATLQFRWVQGAHPAAALALERATLAAALPLGGAAGALVALTALSPPAAPFGAAAWLGVLYFALAGPLPSSFASAAGKGGAPRALAPTRGDGARGALLFCLLPPSLYAAVHRRLLAHAVHGWALLLLAALPPLALAAAPDGLWWLPLAPAPRRAARRALLLTSTAAAVAGFEGRVLLRAAGQYIALPAPWGAVAATAALVPLAAACALRAAGLASDAAAASPSKSDARAAAWAGPALVLAAGAASLAAGAPAWALPAPLAAAAGLALHWDSGAARDYVIFAIGAFGSVAWFAHHHYGFLGADPSADPAGAGVRAAAAAAAAAAAPALALAGAVSCRAPRAVVGGALLLQAATLAALEQSLFSGGPAATADADAAPELYPGYYVLATSVAVALAARSLARSGAAPRGVAAAAATLAAAKASLLLLPASMPVLPLALYAMVAVFPVRAWLAAQGGEGGDRGARDTPRPPPSLALLWAALAAASAFHARFVIFDALDAATGAPPADGAAAGAVLLAAAVPSAAGAAAASARGSRGLLLRISAAAAAAGAAMLLLQPPLLRAWAAGCAPGGAFCVSLFDASHLPLDAAADDAAIWGDAVAPGHSPAWLLIAGAAAAAAAAAGGRPARRARLAAAQSAALAAGAAGAVGAYVAGETFPGAPRLQVGRWQVVWEGAAPRRPRARPLPPCPVLFSSPPALRLCLRHSARPGHPAGPVPVPSRGRPAGAGAAGVGGRARGGGRHARGGAAAAPGRGNALSGRGGGGDGGRQRGRTVRRGVWGGGRSRFLALARVAHPPPYPLLSSTALIAVAAAECLILALAFKLRCSAAAAGGRGRGGLAASAGSADALASAWAAGRAAAPPSTRATPAGAASRALASHGLAWLPAAANAAALAGYGLALAAAGGPAAASPPALVATAVSLLLLGPDPALAPWLAEARRYGPPTAAAALTLAAHAACALAAEAALRRRATEGFDMGGRGPGAGAAREALLVAAALAPHAPLAARAWGLGPPSLVAQVITLPPAALAAAASRLASVRWLAASGAAGLAVSGAFARGTRRAGQRAL